MGIPGHRPVLRLTEIVLFGLLHGMVHVWYVVWQGEGVICGMAWYSMSHIMRKPVYAICEQQRRRSACASTQSDQHLCCLLPGQYNISICHSRSFKTLADLCS